MKRVLRAKQSELEIVTDYLNQTLPEDAIIFLIGDLASGKTTLVQEIVKSKGVTDEVTSPTFSLQHTYGDRLFHYDLYRIDNSEFMEMGLFEEFDRSGWHLVEWGDDSLREFLTGVGYSLFTITITPFEDMRQYIIESC